MCSHLNAVHFLNVWLVIFIAVRPNITCEEGTVVTLENNKVRCEVRAYPLPGDIYWYVKDPESKKVEELRQSTENKGGSVTKTMSISGEVGHI